MHTHVSPAVDYTVVPRAVVLEFICSTNNGMFSLLNSELRLLSLHTMYRNMGRGGGEVVNVRAVESTIRQPKDNFTCYFKNIFHQNVIKYRVCK